MKISSRSHVCSTNAQGTEHNRQDQIIQTEHHCQKKESNSKIYYHVCSVNEEDADNLFSGQLKSFASTSEGGLLCIHSIKASASLRQHENAVH